MPAAGVAAPVLAAPARPPIGKFGGRLGLATLCVSGGMGRAALVQREEAS